MYPGNATRSFPMATAPDVFAYMVGTTPLEVRPGCMFVSRLYTILLCDTQFGDNV